MACLLLDTTNSNSGGDIGVSGPSYLPTIILITSFDRYYSHGWSSPRYYCSSQGLGKAVMEFSEDKCPVLTWQAAVLERAELVLDIVLERS